MLPSNIPSLYQQLQDNFVLFRTALQSKDLTGIDHLLEEQGRLLVALQQGIEAEQEGDREQLALLHQEVSQLVAEAERQKIELSMTLSQVGKKKKQIAMYLKNQW